MCKKEWGQEDDEDKEEEEEEEEKQEVEEEENAWYEETRSRNPSWEQSV